MKKLLYLCLILITCQYATAQVKVTQLDKAAIPKSIKYTGHIINCGNLHPIRKANIW
jgi:hypothetical protein